MSEPRRWKDSPDAPVGMRELLGSARRSRPLDESTFRRGAERVARFSVAPATVAAVSIWAKLAAAGLVGVAAAGTFVAVEAVRVRDSSLATSSTPAPGSTASAVVAPSRAATVEPASTTVETSAPLEPAVLAPLPAREKAPEKVQEKVQEKVPVIASPPALRVTLAPPSTASAAPVTPWVPEEPSRPKSTLSDELVLLERARSHLARSPETALGNLAEHRARYPAGVLADERDLMELDALRRTGRMQDARNRAQAWLDRDPRSMHAARVRQILNALE
jgi:hypothetical protein